MPQITTRCPQCSSYLHANILVTIRGESTGWVELECWDCDFITKVLDD